jgi:hypothetical protein
MAALPLKHLLNHDDGSDQVPVHQRISNWGGNSFLEEYVQFSDPLPRCTGAEIIQEHFPCFQYNHGTSMLAIFSAQRA